MKSSMNLVRMTLDLPVLGSIMSLNFLAKSNISSLNSKYTISTPLTNTKCQLITCFCHLEQLSLASYSSLFFFSSSSSSSYSCSCDDLLSLCICQLYMKFGLFLMKAQNCSGYNLEESLLSGEQYFSMASMTSQSCKILPSRVSVFLKRLMISSTSKVTSSIPNELDLPFLEKNLKTCLSCSSYSEKTVSAILNCFYSNLNKILYLTYIFILCF